MKNIITVSLLILCCLSSCVVDHRDKPAVTHTERMIYSDLACNTFFNAIDDIRLIDNVNKWFVAEGEERQKIEDSYFPDTKISIIDDGTVTLRNYGQSPIVITTGNHSIDDFGTVWTINDRAKTNVSKSSKDSWHYFTNPDIKEEYADLTVSALDKSDNYTISGSVRIQDCFFANIVTPLKGTYYDVILHGGYNKQTFYATEGRINIERLIGGAFPSVIDINPQSIKISVNGITEEWSQEL